MKVPLKEVYFNLDSFINLSNFLAPEDNLTMDDSALPVPEMEIPVPLPETTAAVETSEESSSENDDAVDSHALDGLIISNEPVEEEKTEVGMKNVRYVEDFSYSKRGENWKWNCKRGM